MYCYVDSLVMVLKVQYPFSNNKRINFNDNQAKNHRIQCGYQMTIMVGRVVNRYNLFREC